MANKLGELRRAQILFSGPGAVVDFRTDENTISVIMSGIDEWPNIPNDDAIISNKELAKLVTTKIKERFQEPREDFEVKFFKSPPVVAEENDETDQNIFASRFPKWLLCTKC